MIEGLLFAALGFLLALALAVAIAPSLWRRAEHLERRRIEAALPLTREELEGEIDAIRAESAMAIRRLEVKADVLRKKTIADVVQIEALKERVREQEEEFRSFLREIDQTGDAWQVVEAKLTKHDEQVAGYTARIDELSSQLADQMDKVQQLTRLNDELSLASSTHKIDLVARETEIDKLSSTVELLREQRRETDHLLHEALAEKLNLENALRLEKQHVAELQARVEQLLSEVSARDHALEQPVEIAQPLMTNEAPAAVNGQFQAVIQTVFTGEDYKLPQDGIEAMQTEDTAELQQRVADLSAVHRKRYRKEHEAERIEQLRDEISAIAAEMVRRVADHEGPGSQIDRVLSEPEREVPGPEQEPRPESLAKRVQKLRNAS